MFSRSALRTARHIPQNLSCIRQPFVRYASFTTPPAKKPRSFKNSAARWGLALGGIYFYATSDWLKNEPSYALAGLAPAGTAPPQPTLEELADARRQRRLAAAAGASPQLLDSSGPTTSSSTSTSSPAASKPSPQQQDPGNPAELEQEASSQGAFNEETGEINWDCPCLGGMAYGPCGEEFRTAFSCFVYSEADPKGVDCIEKFKGMQDCFRLHPDVYGAELDDVADEEAVNSVREGEGAPQGQSTSASNDLPDGLQYSSQAGEQSSLPGANVTSTPSASPTSLSGSTGIPVDAPSKQAAGQKQRGEQLARAKGAKEETSALSTDVDGDIAVPSAYHSEKRGRQTEK